MELLKKITIGKDHKTFFFILIAVIFSTLIIKFSLEKRQASYKNTIDSFLTHQNFKKVKFFLLSKINSPYIEENYKLKKGESIQKLLQKYKLENSEISRIIKLIKPYGNPNSIKAGTVIKIIVKKNEEKKYYSLKEIVIPLTKTINIQILQDYEDELIANKIVTQLFKKITLKEGIILNSLYKDATKLKIEPNIIIEFARIYGFEIDFQRDIRKNDKFKILYEKFYDENEKFIKNGSILFASMNVNNREITLYRFFSDKSYGYFNMNGKSIEKALMKTPINGARLSSSFGLRKHPISGFTKMHQGTDFAAPLGTPIMASGTGTVILAKWCGGGGNCIKIKHNSTYSTIYAHMKNFAKGIRVGKKVKQGQIIGYVGSTGISTGPHLHYEVIVNGKKINSQKLKLPSGKVLRNKEREDFEIHRIKTDVLISEIFEKNL